MMRRFGWIYAVWGVSCGVGLTLAFACGSSGSSRTASCTALEGCCSSATFLSEAMQDAIECDTILSANIDAQCASYLSTYSAAGHCSSSGPATCSAQGLCTGTTQNCGELATCCMTQSTSAGRSACLAVVTANSDSACQTAILADPGFCTVTVPPTDAGVAVDAGPGALIDCTESGCPSGYMCVLSNGQTNCLSPSGTTTTTFGCFGEGTCLLYLDVPIAQLPTYESGCNNMQQMSSYTCPSSGLVGCCYQPNMGNTSLCTYFGSASEDQASCLTNSMATWSTTP